MSDQIVYCKKCERHIGVRDLENKIEELTAKLTTYKTQNEELSKRIKELEEDGYRTLWHESQEKVKGAREEIDKMIFAIGSILHSEGGVIKVPDVSLKIQKRFDWEVYRSEQERCTVYELIKEG